jgi:peptidoglycan/xylan/chitin deacetylase (PgdA/CDA1 family)
MPLPAIARVAVRAVARAVSGGTAGRRLVILHYHRVPETADPMCPELLPAPIFAAHMGVLAESFHVLPLDEALQRLWSGTLPTGAVAVTFDDGYADNHAVALPILAGLGLTASFFIATDYLDGGCMFNDLVIEACRVVPNGRWDTGDARLGTLLIDAATDRVALAQRLVLALKYQPAAERRARAAALLACAGGRAPAHLMMTAAEVRDLRAAGMGIGGHTGSHPILARTGDAEAERDIRGGKAALESLLGQPVALFAYPNGKPGEDYGPRDVQLARDAGFTAALTTTWAAAERGSPRFEVPRVGSWDRTPARFALRVLRCFRDASPAVAQPL